MQIMVPSFRPWLIDGLRKSIGTDKRYELIHVDGTGTPSCAWLWNQCVVRCESEEVVICADKVRPTAQDVDVILNRLEQGYGLVCMYGFKFFAFSKQLLRSIGMFDERYLGGYYEDYDIVLRMYESNIGYLESWEVPCLKMGSSWRDKGSRRHWLSKWERTDRGFVRKLPEEVYDYDLGPSIERKYLDRKVSSLEPRHGGTVLRTVI